MLSRGAIVAVDSREPFVRRVAHSEPIWQENLETPGGISRVSGSVDSSCAAKTGMV